MEGLELKSSASSETKEANHVLLVKIYRGRELGENPIYHQTNLLLFRAKPSTHFYFHQSMGIWDIYLSQVSK